MPGSRAALCQRKQPLLTLDSIRWPLQLGGQAWGTGWTGCGRGWSTVPRCAVSVWHCVGNCVRGTGLYKRYRVTLYEYACTLYLGVAFAYCV
jgi:hypothetical protein